MRAAAGPCEPSAITEDEIAVLTECRVQDEPFRFVARDSFHYVRQVLLNLPLGNTEHLGQLVCRQTCADQQFDQALARGAFRKKHGGYGRWAGVEAQEVSMKP